MTARGNCALAGSCRRCNHHRDLHILNIRGIFLAGSPQVRSRVAIRIALIVLLLTLPRPLFAAPKVWVTDTLTKISLETRPAETAAVSANLTMARNEYESVQIGIVDLGA